MKEWRKGNYDSSHLLIRRPGQYTGTCPPAIVQSEKLMLGRGLPSRALEARAPARGPLEHSRAEGCAFECPWQRDTSAFWKPWLQLLPCETRPGGRDLGWGRGTDGVTRGWGSVETAGNICSRD